MKPSIHLPVWQRSILQTALLALFVGSAGPASAIDLLFTASAQGSTMVNGVVTSGDNSTSGSAGAAAAAPNASASGIFGVLLASSSATAFSSGVAAGPPFTSSSGNGSGSVSVVWLAPQLDPSQAGLLARVSYDLSGSASAGASVDASGEANASAFISGFGAFVSSAGSASACNAGCAVTPMEPLSGSFDVRAGEQLILAAGVTSGAGAGSVFIQGATSAGSSATVTLNFGFELIEDRRHWNAGSGAALLADASWIEKASPDATAWATFNSTEARTLALTLPLNHTWRGLIVDGESVSLDLAGNTLKLGTAGPSLKTYSIRVGEGRQTASSLTLRGGTVLAENDVLVSGPFGSTGPTATLTLEAGAVLNQTTSAGLGSLAVGDQGPGALVVRGGSQLNTNLLALSRKAAGAEDLGPLRSSLLIDGVGTRVTTTLVSLGDLGEATAAVRGGGVLQAQALNLAQQPSGRATLTIDGAGSKLVMTGGFANVGLGGRATLQAMGGGVIEGNGSTFLVGSGKVSDFSVMRISGPGSELTGATAVVNTGGLFEVRDGARWSGPGNLLEVKGGQATFNDAHVKLGDVTVAGLFNGSSLVSTGQWNIENGAVVDATGSDLFVSAGGRLTLNGSGSRLFGFNDLNVNGLLIVNFGSVLEGDTLGLKSDASLQGTGTVKVNEKFTVEGQLKPGNSPGVLRIDGNVELTDTALLELEVGGTTAGTEYDVLQVTGSLTLQGGRVGLSFINGFAPSAGQQFVLLDVGGSFQSTASFGVTGLETGWQFSTAFDATTGKLTLNSLNDGVSAVPEPAAWLLWGAGLAAVLWRRRGRLPFRAAAAAGA